MLFQEIKDQMNHPKHVLGELLVLVQTARMEIGLGQSKLTKYQFIVAT